MAGRGRSNCSFDLLDGCKRELPVVRFLRWERNREEGVRDRRKGWYMPVAIELERRVDD